MRSSDALTLTTRLEAYINNRYTCATALLPRLCAIESAILQKDNNMFHLKFQKRQDPDVHLVLIYR